VIDDLFEAPVVRIVDLARRKHVHYPTAKSDIEYLIKKGVLAVLPDAKIKKFLSPEIFAIAYVDENGAQSRD
jgi:hypothetical protein